MVTINILITTDQYTRTNGVTTLVKGLCHQLEARHEVKVLTLSPHKKSYRQGNIYFIGSYNVPIGTKDRYTFKRRDELVEELVVWKPDILHVQTEFSVFRLAKSIARRTGAPMVNTIHTMYDSYLRLFVKNEAACEKAYRTFARRAYSHSKYITVPTQAVKRKLDTYGLSCPVEVLPSGVDLSLHGGTVTCLQRQELLKQYGVAPDAFVLVTVARLGIEKNISELIAYMPALLRQIPKAALLIVGDGHYRAWLEQQVKKSGLGNCIRFTGNVPLEETFRYYRLGDVFVCASVSEVQSLCNIEALANGLPLVCRQDSALDGLLLEGETGFAYADEEEYLIALTKLFSDQTLRTQMQQKAKKQAAFYNICRYATRLEEIYHQIARGYTNAAR